MFWAGLNPVRLLMEEEITVDPSRRHLIYIKTIVIVMVTPLLGSFWSEQFS